ncbi:MAG: mechanosensitive ion channel [Symploca sp. SIO2B6]|nr:mechanosensitive ion channel [Symploca sp. SIO2B6]
MKRLRQRSKQKSNRWNKRRWQPSQWRTWVWGLLVSLLFVTGFLTISPVHAQTSSLTPVGQAPVVVDGHVVFSVKNTDNLTARERARHINSELRREIERATKRSEQITIEVVYERKKDLVYLQGQSSQDKLITVTRVDVTIPNGEPIDQADIWAEELQQRLRQGQVERTQRYLRQATLYSVIALGGAIALQIIFQIGTRISYHRLKQWFEYSTNGFTTWEKPIKFFWHLGCFGFRAGLWLTVIYYITNLFPQARTVRYGVFNALTSDVIQLGEGRYSPLALLLLILATVGLWFGTNAVTYLLRVYVFSQAQLERRVQDIISVLFKYIMLFLGAMILLQLWGIDASSLTILASVLGVGIGFGVQNITNNFISGFIITLERPIQVGDFINVGDLVGTVENIGGRSTEIRTLDQVTIIIPNSRFLESEVINWSHGCTDALEPKKAIDHWKSKGIDLSSILYQPEVGPEVGTYCQIPQDHGLDKSLDITQLLDLCKPAIENGE